MADELPRVRSPCDHAPIESRWRTVAVVALVLLVGAVVPSPLRRRSAFDRVGPDKLLHFVGHAGLATAVADALAAGRLDDREAAVLSAVVSVAYGALIGRLQRWIPGRVPERPDLVAGALGAVLGVVWRQYGDGAWPPRRS